MASAVEMATKEVTHAQLAADAAEKANTLKDAQLAVNRAQNAVSLASKQKILTGMDEEARDEVNDAVTEAKQALTRAKQARDKLQKKYIPYMSHFFTTHWEKAQTAQGSTFMVDNVSKPENIYELTLKNMTEPIVQLKFFFVNLLYWLSINNKDSFNQIKNIPEIVEFIETITFDNDKKNNLIKLINEQISRTKYLKYKTKYLNLKRQM